jgi:hypothetical protein
MAITFEPTGTVHAMHRDEFDLGFLGRQEIKRASEIKFHDDSQKWDIHVPPCADATADQWYTFHEIRGFSAYNSARKFEVLWLEHCAKDGIAPLSTYGMELAATLRAKYGDFQPLDTGSEK